MISYRDSHTDFYSRGRRALARRRMQEGSAAKRVQIKEAAAQLKVEKKRWAQQVAANRELQQKLMVAHREDKEAARKKRLEDFVLVQRQRALETYTHAKPRVRALDQASHSRNASVYKSFFGSLLIYGRSLL